jgi:hypothetical protein
MRKQIKTVLIVIVGIFAVAYFVIKAVDKYHDPKRVAYMLNIPAPPKTLHIFECESGPITDIAITCAIKIDPREFPLLLKGYTYTQSPIEGTSYAVGNTKVGPEFPVSEEYIARPATFKDGGAVTILADKEKKRAIVDLYIE